jgi:hypothetical protein
MADDGAAIGVIGGAVKRLGVAVTDLSADAYER